MLAPLAVVLVHRRQPRRCVETVAAFAAQDVPVAVTVVDNGSPEADLAELRAGLVGHPAELVELGENTGFGPAANVGLARWLASGSGDEGLGEWAVVAPHDARPEEGCLTTLLDVLGERPRAGLASADVGDGVTPIIDRYFGSIPAPSEVEHGWEAAGYPHGTLMVARRACLEEVGLFDERYFAYCEEADLGERARRAGWEVGVVRGARVTNTHLGSPTASVDYLQQRNTLLLVRDHFGRYAGFIRCCTALIQLASGVLRPASRSEVFSAPARVRAVGDHLRGRYGPPPAGLEDDPDRVVAHP